MNVSMIWNELAMVCVKMLPCHSSSKSGAKQRNLYLSSETFTFWMKVRSIAVLLLLHVCCRKQEMVKVLVSTVDSIRLG
jgi:hypothetical protein